MSKTQFLVDKNYLYPAPYALESRYHTGTAYPRVAFAAVGHARAAARSEGHTLTLALAVGLAAEPCGVHGRGKTLYPRNCVLQRWDDLVPAATTITDLGPKHIAATRLLFPSTL